MHSGLWFQFVESHAGKLQALTVLQPMHVSPEMRYELKVPLWTVGTNQIDTKQRDIC